MLLFSTVAVITVHKHLQESSSSAAHMQTATDVSSELSTTERPLSNGFTSMTGSHDYTREICYPARSGILVQPLQDDDWEILQSLNGSAQPQLPMYFDHTPLHPSKMEMEKGTCADFVCIN